MLLNIIVILFLLAMAYWWSTQGLFSAMLHLVMVIVAGAMALAMWEPIVFLMLRLPEVVLENLRYYVWGLGLLLPFLVLLGLLRTLGDKMIRGNVHIHGTVSQIGGGVCGIASGILTAGITIIALNFLGGAPPLAGYQPYAVSHSTGQIEPNPDGGGLLLKVDHWTAGFFSRLSRAGFGDGWFNRTPLATHRPNLAKEAAVFTMRYDPHALIVAGPNGVELDQVYTWPTSRHEELGEVPEAIRAALGSEFQSGEHRLVVIDSEWYNRDGTYDPPSTLRVPPTQVRLLTHQTDRRGRREAHLHEPRAFSRVVNRETGAREFFAVDNAGIYASSTASQQRLGWAFIVPYEHEPVAAFLRQLRLPIERTIESASDVLTALGAPRETDEPEADRRAERDSTDDADEVEEVEELQLTNQLPRAISRNEATRLRYSEVGDVSYVESGQDEVGRSPHGLSRRIRVEAIYEQTHMATVRLQIRGDRAHSLFGRAMQLARQLQSVSLTDDRGDVHWPIGYAWEKGGRAMEINFPRGATIRSASQLPISQMEEDHRLYLYFQVGRGVTITGYQAGEESRTGLNVHIPSN